MTQWLYWLIRCSLNWWTDASLSVTWILSSTWPAECCFSVGGRSVRPGGSASLSDLAALLPEEHRNRALGFCWHPDQGRPALTGGACVVKCVHGLRAQAGVSKARFTLTAPTSFLQDQAILPARPHTHTHTHTHTYIVTNCPNPPFSGRGYVTMGSLWAKANTYHNKGIFNGQMSTALLSLAWCSPLLVLSSLFSTFQRTHFIRSPRTYNVQYYKRLCN